MINQIFSTGKYIVINHNADYESTISAEYNTKGQIPNPGDLRYINGVLQYYNYGYWNIMNTHACISLTSEAENLLDWVREQKKLQNEAEIIAKTNPSVKIALENLNKAKTQLSTTILLSKEYPPESHK